MEVEAEVVEEKEEDEEEVEEEEEKKKEKNNSDKIYQPSPGRWGTTNRVSSLVQF